LRSLGGAAVCLQCSYYCLFLDLMLCLLIYNLLIIINHVGIFVCTDDIPLLNVNFFLYEALKCLANILLWCIYRCITTDILPATCRCAGCPSACTTDCRSVITWPSRPTVGRIGHVLADWLSVG